MKLLAAMLLLAPAAFAQVPEVTVTGVAANHSAAKVYFAPVKGAQDYRVYDVTNPNDVKYGGWTHLKAGAACTGRTARDQAAGSSCFKHFVTNADGSLKWPLQAVGEYSNGAQGGPTGYDGPAMEVDWNGLGDGLPHTLVVEAVDRIGPVPFDNLYQMINFQPVPLSTHAGMEGMSFMLGGNKGGTLDGKVSTNGQGPYTNKPNVIATSKPFVVQADRAMKAIPSTPAATQTFFDTFENGTPIALVSRSDNTANAQGDVGPMQYTMGTGALTWDIFYRQCNNTLSMPFVSNAHFMDVLFDKDATIYCSMSMTPRQSISLNGGIIHVTMQVDDVLFGDRWLDINISPASDPLTHWNHQLGGALNTTNQALYLMYFGDERCEFHAFNGPASPDLKTIATDSGNLWQCDLSNTYDPRTFTSNGLGFDNKRQWDFFVSAGRAALFIDGRLVQQAAIPAGAFTWSNQPLKVYFTHYQYHSDNGPGMMMNEDRSILCQPLMSYWFNDVMNGVKAGAPNTCDRDYPPGFGVRGSDERHWDGMGAEVLPASSAPANDFSSLAALIKLPVRKPPVFSGTVPPVVEPPIVIPPVTPPASVETCYPVTAIPTLKVSQKVCVTTSPL